MPYRNIIKNVKSVKKSPKKSTGRVELIQHSVFHESSTSNDFQATDSSESNLQTVFKEEPGSDPLCFTKTTADNKIVKKEEVTELQSNFEITPYQPRLSFSSIRYMDSFVCPYCQKKFNERSALVLHEPKCKLKSQEGSLKCEFCEKTFADEFTMEIHINVEHVNTKTHKCKECDFSTTKYFLLRNHKMTHMNLVKCQKCDKNFLNEKLMLEHVSNTHGGGSEFRCSRCGNIFKTSVHLERHIKTNHGELLNFFLQPLLISAKS